MLEIDGSLHSGSGTILRYAVALATLVHEPLHLVRIRAKRSKAGLRPQHLLALRACSSLCSGRLEGDAVGSQEIYYWPGPELKGGDYQWDIGTAGSTTMLAFTLISPALFASAPSRFSITGGLFQDNAPSAFHMQKVLAPTLRRMGAHIEVEVIRPGYVPQGGGHLEMKVYPLSAPLQPLRMLQPGKVKAIHGTSLSSHLEKERVSERMAERCHILLDGYGYSPSIEVRHDVSAIQKGAVLTLWAETQEGCCLGADQAGKPGRRSEAIAQFVVNSLMEDFETGATTDRHLADQLILFAALANGKTEYLVPLMTEHVESNLWLVNKILSTKVSKIGNLLGIEGTGFHRS